MFNVSICCCACFKSDGDEAWEPLGQKQQATFPCCQSQGSLDTYKGHQDRILEQAGGTSPVMWTKFQSTAPVPRLSAFRDDPGMLVTLKTGQIFS